MAWTGCKSYLEDTLQRSDSPERGSVSEHEVAGSTNESTRLTGGRVQASQDGQMSCLARDGSESISTDQGRADGTR